MSGHDDIKVYALLAGRADTPALDVEIDGLLAKLRAGTLTLRQVIEHASGAAHDGVFEVP